MSGIILVFLVLFALQAATGYWWWVFVVPFLCGAFRARTPFACIRSSGGGAGLLWMIAAAFALLTDGDRITEQVAAMGGIENPLVIVLAAAFIAAVAGSLAGIAGYQLKMIITRRPRLQEIHIAPITRRRTQRHDRRRAERENQEDRGTPVQGGAGRSRAH